MIYNVGGGHVSILYLLDLNRLPLLLPQNNNFCCCSLIEGRWWSTLLLLLWSRWGTNLQLILSGGDGGIVRRCKTCGEFLSMLLLLAPRALASNLVINSLLRRSSLFLVIFIDAIELCGLSFLLDLGVFLASKSLASVHVKDQVFLGTSWLIYLGLFVLCAWCSWCSNG